MGESTLRLSLSRVDRRLEKDFHPLDAEAVLAFESLKYWSRFAIKEVEIGEVDGHITLVVRTHLKGKLFEEHSVIEHHVPLDPQY